MNRLSKILIIIIIILVITLGIMTYLYIQYMTSNKKAVEELYKTDLAIENAGFKIERQDDDSFVLVEREMSIERDKE